MQKKIKLSNNSLIIYDKETSDGFDAIGKFYEPKINYLITPWLKRIPFHDKKDLLQILRIKLWDALDHYNENMNIQFSTYVYTAWHRKLSQLERRYKSKRYSTFFDKSKNVSFNHVIDKKTNHQYLRLDKDKCPLKNVVIEKNTCNGCPYFLKHKTIKTTKGFEKGEKNKHTMCNYYVEVMNKRGLYQVSLDKIIGVDARENSYNEIHACSRQMNEFRDMNFNIDISKLKEKMDPNQYAILELLNDGYNKNEIMQKLNIKKSKYNSFLDKISKDKNLINILK